MTKTMTRKTAIKPTKTTATTDYVVIDHPKNMETITSRHYTIRIGSGECCRTEISIDDQPWQSCRYAVGFWWYDWHSYSTGFHQAVARIHKNNGEYIISKRRRFKVI